MVQHAPILLSTPLVLHRLEGCPEPSRAESEGGDQIGGCKGGGKVLGYHHLNLLII